MKFKAPQGHTGINIGGQQFNVDGRGEITLPDQGIYTLPAGWERVEEATAATPSAAGDQHAEE
jgi:hypothetical protein